MIARDVLSRNPMLDGELYVVVMTCICQAMLIQSIMPVPPFDAGRKIRSCLILVDRLTLPKVAARGILWSLSIRAIGKR